MVIVFLSLACAFFGFITWSLPGSLHLFPLLEEKPSSLVNFWHFLSYQLLKLIDLDTPFDGVDFDAQPIETRNF